MGLGIIDIARMDEAFVADEQVASREGLVADFAQEGLLLGMCPDVPLEMLQPGEESLTVRAWQRLDLAAGRLAPHARCLSGGLHRAGIEAFGEWVKRSSGVCGGGRG